MLLLLDCRISNTIHCNQFNSFNKLNRLMIASLISIFLYISNLSSLAIACVLCLFIPATSFGIIRSFLAKLCLLRFIYEFHKFSINFDTEILWVNLWCRCLWSLHFALNLVAKLEYRIEIREITIN